MGITICICRQAFSRSTPKGPTAPTADHSPSCADRTLNISSCKNSSLLPPTWTPGILPFLNRSLKITNISPSSSSHADSISNPAISFLLITLTLDPPPFFPISTAKAFTQINEQIKFYDLLISGLSTPFSCRHTKKHAHWLCPRKPACSLEYPAILRRELLPTEVRQKADTVDEV